MADTYDETTPVGTEAISNGDDRIRELKRMITIFLRGNTTDGTEAKFPGSDTANPIYRYRGLKGSTGSRPAAGQYGLYVNTTLNTLQRDNGSTWDDVATLIPSGTVAVFYQASAPTGWTAVAVNDKFLRVVTAGGTGGSTGGTMAASTSINHSHSVNSHTHTISAPNSSSAGAANTFGHAGASDTTGSAAPGTDSQLAGAFARADVIIATKD
jgi:hypothetical protein